LATAAFCPQIPKNGNEAIGIKTQGKPVPEKREPNGLGLFAEDCVQEWGAQRLSFHKGFDFERIDSAKGRKSRFPIGIEPSNFISKFCNARALLLLSQRSSKDPKSVWRNEQEG
jgi:hypothetical protein